MSVFNSVSGALAALIVVLMIVGLAMGLLLNNTDLANFIRNSAVADHQRVVNDYEAAKNDVDIQFYWVERQQQTVENLRQISAESQARIAQREELLRFERENNDLRLEREAMWANATVTTLVAFGIGLAAALSMGITFVLYRMVQLLPAGPALTTPVAAQSSARSEIDREPWHDPIHRAWRVAQARSRELKEIESQLAQNARLAQARATARRSNDGHAVHKISIR
jgi:hypothetical protein